MKETLKKLFIALLEFLYNLINKKDTDSTCYISITRRGYDIVLDADVYESLTADKITISLVLASKTKKPCCVQLNKTVNGKQTYKGTLKSYLNVKGFKDGNICNFKYDNLILKDN